MEANSGVQESVASPAGPFGGPPSPSRYRMAFLGQGVDLAIVVLKGMLLTLVTLGIYYPWYKTERRIFMWQNIDFHGHRLRYHGTGRELFAGYAKVVAAYLVAAALIAGASTISDAAAAIAQGVLFLALIVLVPLAIYGSRRYLLSRTSWRSIRFGLDGSAGEFTDLFIKGALLTGLTLGLYRPIMTHRVYTYMMNHTRLGDQRFRYTGERGAYWRLSMKWLLISIVTLGIGGLWGLAAQNRYQVEHTHFQNARGVWTLTGFDIFKLVAVQMVGLTLTLGLAFPWIAVWSMHYTLERMGFEGDIDFEAVGQAPSTGDAAADGLGDALDVGLGL